MESRHIIKNFFQKLHQKSPKLAKALSFSTATSVIMINSFGGSVPLWLMGVTKTFTKSKFADKVVIGIAKHWINSNNAMIDHILPKKDWRIHISEDILPNQSYLLVCNHQSWVDTCVVQYVSQNRLPLTRFFAKYELIYIPIVGQAFYFLDFPMMRRYSKEQVAKNPALKGQDIVEARRACELLKGKPFVLLNYLEGTRCTPAKQKKQASPYQYLLKPRAGGLSLAISALGTQVDGILDMTIVYPDGVPSYFDLWQGNISRLGVDIRRLDIPDELFSAISQGNYDKDEATKQAMFAWVDKVWQEKDKRIEQMLQEFN